MTCCFFGHKDTRPEVFPIIVDAIRELITSHDVDTFLVGNHGSFDGMALKALRQLKQEYSHINYSVVLAYMPAKKQEHELYEYSETMLPEGIENVLPRFAISWRNKWMIKESEWVIAYVTHSWGGAAQALELAEKKGLSIMNLRCMKHD